MISFYPWFDSREEINCRSHINQLVVKFQIHAAQQFWSWTTWSKVSFSAWTKHAQFVPEKPNINVYNATHQYKVESKSSIYNPWIAQEPKLWKNPKKSRKPGTGRQTAYPEMEKQLYKEFKVKEWWFRNRCKEIMKEKYPHADFKMSDHWLVWFKACYDIALRRPTNVAQSHPELLRFNIHQFHRYIRRMVIKVKQDIPKNGIVGPWDLSDIASMDQAPLEFTFNTKGATYETKGEKTVWTRSTKTAVYCAADSICRWSTMHKTLSDIQGLRKANHWQRNETIWPTCCHKKFQERAWCDKEMMMYWVRHLWTSQSTFLSTNAKRSRLPVYDQHKAQTTKKVKGILQNECKTTLALVPLGAKKKFSPSMLQSTVNSKNLLIAWQERQWNPNKLPQAKEGSFCNGQGKPGKRFLAVSEM